MLRRIGMDGFYNEEFDDFPGLFGHLLSVVSGLRTSHCANDRGRQPRSGAHGRAPVGTDAGRPDPHRLSDRQRPLVPQLYQNYNMVEQMRQATAFGTLQQDNRNLHAPSHDGNAGRDDLFLQREGHSRSV